MAERFQELFKQTEPLFLKGAPVIIEAIALLKDTITSKVLVQLKLRNISNKEVSACKVNVRAFEPNGNEVEGVDKYSYLDITAAPGIEFGSRKAIYLPDETTRNVKVCVVEAVFSDGTIWNGEKTEWTRLPEQVTVSSFLQDEELVKQWNIEATSDCDYIPADKDGLFFCTCGSVNLGSNGECNKCHRNHSEIVSLFDITTLEKNKASRLEEEARIAAEEEAARIKTEEEAAQRKAATMKKAKKIAAIVVPLAVIIALFVILWPGTIKPAYDNFSRYHSAKKALEAGSYDEAIHLFTELKNYKDSAEMVKESQYRKADSYANEEAYDEALTWFSGISSYSNASERIEEIKELLYERGCHEVLEKQFAAAIEDFNDLSRYKYLDSAEKILETHYAWGADAFDNEDYLVAVREFTNASKYSDANDRYRESAYQYACKMMQAESYQEAILYFEKCGNSYKDVRELFNESNYSYGNELLASKEYKSAVIRFTACAGYKDANKKALDAKYEYVLANKNSKDSTTSNYLQDLIKSGYSGAKVIYNEIYHWKATVTINNGASHVGWNQHTDVTVIISDGPPTGSIKVRALITFPNGSVSTSANGWVGVSKGSTFSFYWEDGCMMQATYGSLIIRVVDSDGNELGRGTVNITAF